MAGITSTYIDADTFTVATDMTLAFVAGRRVKCDCGVDGDKYGTVESSSYAALTTTVNLASGSDALTSNLVSVWFGIVKPGTSGSVPEHSHDWAEGSGGSVSPSVFYADPDETDQGAAGDGNTIKAFVDAISTDSATIYLRHNSGSATTTYTLTTSETIPSGITLEIEKGAIIDGAGTLTISGKLKAGPNQIFGTSILVIFGAGSARETYPEWWGARGDSVTNDTIALNSALTRTADTIRFLPNKTYMTSGMAFATALNLIIPDTTTIKLIDGSNATLLFASGKITINGGIFDGNRANQTSGGIGFDLRGAGTKVFNTIVKNTLGTGINSYNADDILIKNSIVLDTTGHGILIGGVSNDIDNIRVLGCLVDRSSETPATVLNSGIHVQGDGVRTYLVTNAKILGNTVKMPVAPTSVTAQCIVINDGDDTCVINNNTVINGNSGIIVGLTHGISVTGNAINGQNEYGIYASKVSDIAITGNVIRNITSFGIVILNTFNFAISGCHIEDGQIGIYTTSNELTIDVEHGSIAGCTIENQSVAGIRITGTVAKVAMDYLSITGVTLNNVVIPLDTYLTGSATIGENITAKGCAGLIKESVSYDILNLKQALYHGFGTGTPEAAFTANLGSLYQNYAGGANTSLYIKETGAGNTGWVAK